MQVLLGVCVLCKSEKVQGSVQFIVLLIFVQVALDYIGKRGSTGWGYKGETYQVNA
jgi:hypothetical protein